MKRSKKILIFVVVGLFLALFAIVVGMFMRGWQENLDEGKRVEQINKVVEEYIDIYRKDTYGGETPQETLDLFVSALEADDIDLASKYFMPDDSGSREKWVKVLTDTKDAGNFSILIPALKIAEPEPRGIIGDSIYEMVSRNEEGQLLVDVILKFNGNVWKIDKIF